MQGVFALIEKERPRLWKKTRKRWWVVVRRAAGAGAEVADVRGSRLFISSEVRVDR